MGPCSATHQLQQGALLALHCRYYKLLHLCLLWLAVAGDQTHFATDYFKSTVGPLGTAACILALSRLCKLGLNGLRVLLLCNRRGQLQLQPASARRMLLDSDRKTWTWTCLPPLPTPGCPKPPPQQPLQVFASLLLQTSHVSLSGLDATAAQLVLTHFAKLGCSSWLMLPQSPITCAHTYPVQTQSLQLLLLCAAGFSVNSQPASVQPRYNQPMYDQAAPVHYEESAYETYEASVPDEYAEAAPVAQSANPQFIPPHASASQHACSMHHVTSQAAPHVGKTDPPAAPFDMDAWLADLNIGAVATPAQHQGNSSSGGDFDSVTVAYGGQQPYDGAQYGSQNGAAGTRSSYSPDDGSSKSRYMPPHMRTDSGQVVNDISNSYQQPVRKQVPPPGFSGRIA